MQVIEYNKDYQNQLFKFWKDISKTIPYFFNIDFSTWYESFFYDQNEEEFKFIDLNTFIAINSNDVVGFIQFGQPLYHYDTNGNRHKHPDVGVIRHVYFKEELVGKKLIDIAIDHLKRYPKIFAFYHILGLSCNANHGKLFEKYQYIESILYSYGFQIEHENYYYIINFKNLAIKDSKLIIEVKNNIFTALYNNEVVGTAKIQFIKADNIVYLTWIGITKKHCGMGTMFINKIFQYLKNNGYTIMHTDTANTNIIAQKFYEKNGFINQGYTRSYLLNN